MATGVSIGKGQAPLPPSAANSNAPSAPMPDESEPNEDYDPHTKYPNTSI